MTLNDEYTRTAPRTQRAAASATDAWADTVQRTAEQFRTSPLPQFPRLPQVSADVTAFVEQWFDFTDRVTKVNREYALNLASAVNGIGGAVRQHMEGLGDAVRDQAQSVSTTAKDQLEKVADAEREQADAERAQADRIEQAEREIEEEAERAERAEAARARRAERRQAEEAEQARQEKAREARAAERQKARQARQEAQERYEGMTKAELAEELSNRELPKTGTVGELVERLVDADTK